MTDMLFTLLGGLLAISITFLLLYRFSRLGGKATAVVIALLVIGIYMPIVILDWPGADVFAIHIAVYLVSVYVLGIITAQRDVRRGENDQQGWFHWGPAALVVFFALVIAADSVFILLAQKGIDSDIARWLLPEPRSGAKVSSHFPGTVARDFRKQQDEFNQFQARMQAQQERNWQIQKGWLGVAQSGKPARFKLRVVDNAGEPVAGAKVKGIFLRPGNSQLDQVFRMQELQNESGSYLAELVLPEPGKWDLLLRLHSGEIVHEIKATTTIEAGN